jgi:ABC-type branched-subunit amino acid transport system ATPase component
MERISSATQQRRTVFSGLHVAEASQLGCFVLKDANENKTSELTRFSDVQATKNRSALLRC